MFMFVLFILFGVFIRIGSRESIGVGWNGYGILGNGDRLSHQTPVIVGNGDPFRFLPKPFEFIISGYRHTFIKAGKNVYGFGTDNNCVLGFADSSSRSTKNVYPSPTKPILLSKNYDIEKLSSAWSHTVALTSDGSVFVWGSTNGQFSTPVGDWGVMCEPQQIFSDGNDVSVGLCHTLIALQNGTVFGTGCNDRFELGLNQTEFSFSSYVRIPIDESVSSVSAGNTFSVYLTESKKVFWNGVLNCWQCSSSRTIEQPVPKEIFPTEIYGEVETIHSGFFHALVMLKNKTLYGFGINQFSCLGLKNIQLISPDNPIKIDTSMITSSGDSIKKFVPMDASTTVLTEQGRIFYMGQNFSLSILSNDGTSVFSELTDISSHLDLEDEVIIDIDASGNHMNAISNRSAFCWGDNFYYQCGTTPRKRVFPFQKSICNEFHENVITKVVLSFQHGIAITSTGDVFSFGINDFGQLGYESFDSHFYPVPIGSSVEDNWRIVSGDVSSQTGLLVDDRGRVYIFGSGDGVWTSDLNTNEGDNSVFVTTPHLIVEDYFHNQKIRKVITSSDHAHALSEDGNVYSWGSSDEGSLGLGKEILFSKIPMLINSSHFNYEKVIQLASGSSYVLALTDQYKLFQWGDMVFTPVQVEFSEIENTKISLIEAGDGWNIAVLEDRQLYLWGKLGDAKHLPIKEYKSPILFWEAPRDGLRIVQCVTQYHSICVLSDGTAYGLGNNEWNQLFIPHDEDSRKYLRNFTRIEVSFNTSQAALSDYSSVLQEFLSCNGYLDSEEMYVCSGHGVCVGMDSCDCFFGYEGKSCSQYSCGGENNIPCSGNGVCVGPDTCKCDPNWLNYPQYSGDTEDEYGYCKYPKCPIDNMGKICGGGGKGKCTVISDIPHCSCTEEYRGEACQFPVCNGVNSTGEGDNGCGFSSECVSPNVCKCVLNGLNSLAPFTSSSEKGCVLSFSFVTLYVIILLAILILFCLCMTCISSVVFTSCCTSCCYCGRYLKHVGEKRDEKVKMEKMKKFEVFPSVADIIFQSETSSLLNVNNNQNNNIFRDQPEEVEEEEEENVVERLFDERSKLLEHERTTEEKQPLTIQDEQNQTEVRTIRLGENHVFKGSWNGEGTIYFFEKKKPKGLYPVFRGSFRKGKRHGFGTLYRYHEHRNPKEERQAQLEGEDKKTSFWEDPRNLKYRGMYSEGKKNGRGREFNSKGAVIRIGEWVHGTIAKSEQLNFKWMKEVDLRNEYVFERMIGEGGFSAVFQAYEKKNPKVKVAVKIFEKFERTLTLDYNEDHHHHEEEGLDEYKNKIKGLVKKGNFSVYSYDVFFHESRNLEFCREVGKGLSTQSMYQHPNIVRILAWSGSQTKLRHFGYVMELCRGSVLDEYCDDYHNKKKTWKLEKKHRILFQIALGMRHIHESMGIIHRDLKLDNCLFGLIDNNVKISDFDFSSRREMFLSGDVNYDGEGAKGSPFHIASECLLTDKFDSSCDVFSFGVVMYEIYFDRVKDPYSILRTGRCPRCHEVMTNRTIEGSIRVDLIQLKRHHRTCEIRPTMKDMMEDYDGEEEDEGEIAEVEGENDNMKEIHELNWVKQLICLCCAREPKRRPTFAQILEIYNQNMTPTSKNSKDRQNMTNSINE